MADGSRSDSYLSMGLTAENLARKYNITREQADEFSLESHKKALAAIAAGKFKDEIAPVEVKTMVVANGAKPGSAKLKTTTAIFDTDEGPRADTSREALAKLSLRSTPMARPRQEQFPDERWRSRRDRDERGPRSRAGVKPMARFLGFATAGVPPAEMGIGPAFAIRKR